MARYKVLKDFQWGKMYLTRSTIITINEQSNDLSVVSLQNSEDTQIVGTKAVEGMVLLEKIEKY